MRALPGYLHLSAPFALCVCISDASSVWNQSIDIFDWKTQMQMCVATQRADPNPSRHYLPPIRASNGWINKNLFRVVFGKGIVPAVQPLGPWLEQRESTLCNTPGGYEEQMSCLLLSSSRLQAVHTSLKMTSWKAEPPKTPFAFFPPWMPILGGGWRFREVWKDSLFVAGLVCCSQDRFRQGPQNP